MRLSVLAAVVAALLLCCASGANAALSFNLYSRDFPASMGASSLKDYVTATSIHGTCVLVALDNGLGGVVRFTYTSNVTDVRQRADVVVSTHKPSASEPTMATVGDADSVQDTKLFAAADLHRLNVEAGVARRSKDRQGTNNNNGAEDAEMSRSSTVAVRPAQDGARNLDGNYAVCFRLVHQAPASTAKGGATVYEEARIRLLEVASTSPSTSTYIARLNTLNSNAAAANGRAGTDFNSEADREYAKMIRMMFRANKNADLHTLLDAKDVVTSKEMSEQLDALKAVQKQLFTMYTNSEHLEERFERMRATAETTFTRIWICMVATVLVMCGTIWFTFHYTKDIIVKRKLI